MTSRQSRASLVQCYDAEWQDHLPPGAAVPEEEAVKQEDTQEDKVDQIEAMLEQRISSLEHDLQKYAEG